MRSLLHEGRFKLLSLLLGRQTQAWFRNCDRRIVKKNGGRMDLNAMDVVYQKDRRSARRASILARHLVQVASEHHAGALEKFPCLQYVSPEDNSGKPAFDMVTMRELMDGHDVEARDEIYELMSRSKLFHLKTVGDITYLQSNVFEDLDTQRQKALDRVMFFKDNGFFEGFLTDQSPENQLRAAALFECLALYDHSLSIKLGVHMTLWGGALVFLGTDRHHKKWLRPTERYEIRGCFSMTELGHGSNVRGIETVTTYDPKTQEFIINTPCESAQKYWIGGAAQHGSHTIVFSQLHIDGRDEGVHAFICKIREPDGQICSGIKIADCGHKIGLNGVDNGRLWFDHVRVPRENLLNSVADVTPEGKYRSVIKNADQRFGAFLSPLTMGRVTIAVASVYQSKVDGAPEVLLLDYPSHRQRLLTLLAKTYAMSFAANRMKQIYVVRTPSDGKTIHVLSSGLKALLTWHFMRTAQECREACGGQGLKADNKVGQLKAEYDVQLTFEGDNNVLMLQVSKALLADFFNSVKKRQPIKSVGLEHMNGPRFVVPKELDSKTLRSPQFQLALLQLRERELLERLAEDVQKRISSGLSFTEAGNESYQIGGRLGEAFSEKQVLEAQLAEEKGLSGPLKEVLSLLRSLYVLTVVDESPTFLRYGLLSSPQSQVIHREVATLCKELRPHALALVDSFGIPLEFLGPIASDWVQYNSWKYVES